jgi:hypothetical protein
MKDEHSPFNHDVLWAVYQSCTVHSNIAVLINSAPYYITEACQGIERQDQRIKGPSTVLHVTQIAAAAEAANAIY